MIPMVDLKAQYRQIRAEVEPALQAVLESARFILGPNVQAFEKEAADYLGAKHAITCASGTDALHLALAAAGIGLGARPVFVDIDPRTFNIDVGQIEAAITPRTRAILPVHLFGQPVDMAPLMAIARRHHLKVIEDCAQSFGACFGDGGMITTDSDELAERLRVLRNHGSTRRYHHSVIGYNSRLDEMQAVILRAKLKRITAYNQGRRAAAHTYTGRLRELPGITPPWEDGRGVHVYHQYTLLTDERDAIMQRLHEARISSAIYYPIPLHRQEVFAGQYEGISLPVSWRKRSGNSIPA